MGDAVPRPTWSTYLDNPGSIPEQCANGAPPVFADATRSVQLFAADFDAPHSWRGNLGWSSQWKKLGFRVDGTYSLNLAQPSTFDLNFANQPQFVLADEGDRAVFVSSSSIVASTGALSSVESRREGTFGRVTQRRSDLRSRSSQLSLTVTPDVGFRYFLRLGYTLGSTRAQFRGFDGAAFDDPGAVEWAPSNFDARHQLLTQAGVVFKGFNITLQHRLTSGLPFTPLVSGDVNGDGLAGDRAFVFDPEASSDAQFASSMGTLLGNAPAAVQRCLREQLGKTAGRNSCRGPWTQSMNMQVALPNKLLRTGQRVNIALNLSNPLAGLDQLLHDDMKLRGWGSPVVPDPILYRVRGFDGQRNRFSYEVNQRFGDTRAAGASLRNPFRLTLDVSIDVGRGLPIQQLDRFLKPGRTQPGAKLSADSLQNRYRRNVPDIYDMILQESDSLLLSQDQVKALHAAQADYRIRMDALWRDLALYLADLPDRFNTAEALKRQEDTIDQGWELSRLEGPKIKAILSPLQLPLLGGTVGYVINAKEKIRIRYFMN